MKEIPQSPNVIVLGGAGEMGRKAVSIISDFENIKELVIADFDLASAEKIVAKNAMTAKMPLKAVSVDVTDSEQLVNLLEGNDIVLNMTGPFYQFNVYYVHYSGNVFKCGIKPSHPYWLSNRIV